MVLVGLYDLCPPAMFYFALSITAIIMIALQNRMSGIQYCVGTQFCKSSKSLTTAIFFIKILYVLVWTWILNIICKNVGEMVSWVLALIPLVLMFIFMGMFISNTFDFDRLIPRLNLLN
jgi:hypothetical protein